MKISEMIKILDIKNPPKFIPLQPGNYFNKSTIFATNEGVCYWTDATIWFCSISEKSKQQVDDIKCHLINYKNDLQSDERKLNRCVAVSELLIAINSHKGIKEKINTNLIFEYENILKLHITNVLDFCEISDMNTLISVIKNNNFFNELLFSATIVKSTEKNHYKGYEKEQKNYRFGNKLFHEELDKVQITAYDDFVKLTFEASGNTYKKNLSINKILSDEEKILSALDYWKNINLN